jgi:hypothetical protein
LNNNIIEQYLMEAESIFVPPTIIKTIRFKATPTFLEILELDWPECWHQFKLLVATKIGGYAIEDYEVMVPLPSLTRHVKTTRIDIDDIVEQTTMLVRSYQRRTGRSAKLICVSPQANAELHQAVHLQVPYDYTSYLRFREEDGAVADPGRWFRGMKIVICPDIVGAVILGEAELSG